MSMRHRGRTDHSTINPAEVKKDHARKIAELNIGYFREKQITAVEVDRRFYYFYQRRISGRRCSCWTLEEAPRRDCPVCWGTSIPVGYDKFGTWSEVFDCSFPDVRSLNTGFNVEQQTRPLRWTLMDGADFGRLEFRIRPQVSDVSVLEVFKEVSRGCTILIKAPTDSDWVSTEGLEDRLNSSYIDFRVDLVRQQNGDGAWLEYIFLRKRIKHEDFIRISADIPRSSDSMQFGDYWSVDVWTPVQLYITGDKLKLVTSRDFFKEVEGSGVWKVTEENPNKPIGVLISHDISARSALQDEIYYKIP